MAKSKRVANGRGSLDKRKDGSSRFRVSWLDDATGGMKYKSFYGKDSTKVMKKYADWVTAGGVDKAKEETNRDADKRTLADLVKDWLWFVSQEKKPTTLFTYTIFANLILLPRLGHVRLKCLQREDIVEFFKSLKLEQGEEGKPRWSDKSRARIYLLLRVCINHGITNAKWLKADPMTGIPRTPTKKRTKTPLTANQAVVLLSHAKGTETYALLKLALDSGARLGELLALEWRDLDVASNMLRIERTLVQLPGVTPHAGSLKGATAINDKVRNIQIGEATVQTLLAHRESLRATGLGECSMVFPTRKGQYTRKECVGDRFRRILERAGLPRIRFHDLRHTVGTLLAQAGVPIPAIQARLGHANATTTIDLYIKGNTDVMQQHVTDALAALYRETAVPPRVVEGVRLVTPAQLDA